MSVTISGDGTITGVLVDKRIEAFTASGTFTVPAGVTYAIAHMLGGGGGIGESVTGGAGSASSVAFTGGTVSANGGTLCRYGNSTISGASAGPANSGRSASQATNIQHAYNDGSAQAQWIVAGAVVTPAEEITVTVGAGGSAGTDGAAGGSGYVFIEYYV